MEQIDIRKIKREDCEVVEYLRSASSDMFRELKKAPKAVTKHKKFA